MEKNETGYLVNIMYVRQIALALKQIVDSQLETLRNAFTPGNQVHSNLSPSPFEGKTQSRKNAQYV